MKRVAYGMCGVLMLCLGICTAGCSDLLVATVLGSGTAVAGMVSLISALFGGISQIKIPGITAVLVLAMMQAMAGCSEQTKKDLKDTLDKVDSGVRIANDNGLSAIGFVHLKSGGHFAIGPAGVWDGPVEGFIVVTGGVEGYGKNPLVEKPATTQPVEKTATGQ